MKMMTNHQIRFFAFCVERMLNDYMKINPEKDNLKVKEEIVSEAKRLSHAIKMKRIKSSDLALKRTHELMILINNDIS